MASTSQGSTTQQIALQTLSSPNTAQTSASAISQQASQPQIQAITQQAQANVQGQAAIPPGNTPAGPAAPATTTLAGPTLAIPFLTKTYAGNIIGILGLLFALVALGFSIFSSVVTYLDLKWSEQVNAIQACTSLYSIRRFSAFCNETLEHGVDASPLRRRWLEDLTIPVQITARGIDPISLTSKIGCTVAVGFIAIIFSRPRMQPFTPYISSVRQEAQIWLNSVGYIQQYIRGSSRPTTGLKVTVETLRLLEEEFAKLDKNTRAFEIGQDICWISKSADFEESSMSSKHDVFKSVVSSSADSNLLPTVRIAKGTKVYPDLVTALRMEPWLMHSLRRLRPQELQIPHPHSNLGEITGTGNVNSLLVGHLFLFPVLGHEPEYAPDLKLGQLRQEPAIVDISKAKERRAQRLDTARKQRHLKPLHQTGRKSAQKGGRRR